MVVVTMLQTERSGFFDPFPPEKAIDCITLLWHTRILGAALDVEAVSEVTVKCRREDTFAEAGDTTSR
jgi:hypothetical protein